MYYSKISFFSQPFSRTPVKNNLNINAWYCTKIQSPYNEEINFTYDKVAYTYYKLAENKSDKDNYYGICNSVINKINKVYVRSSQISTITTRNSKISFNPENKLCYLDYSFNPPQEVCVNASIPRYDIDSWGNWPTNSSEAKILKTIVVSDNEASPTQTIKYEFNYDYFTGTDHALPTNYTYAEVGTTHQKKLILKTIVMPDNSITTLNYQNETASQPTRFTYGVDHWGYYNGIQTNIQPYGFLGADNYFQSCRSNRTPNFSVATSGLLNNLSTSTGFNLNLVYEAHNASNYGNIPIGGFRIKEVQSTDPIRNLSIKKTYNYTLANNASSGFLFVSPTYTVYSPGFLYGHSDLFASLIAESQRPIVGYSRVEELITSVPASPSNGKTIYYFDVDDTPAKILQNQGCYILNIPCVENPIYFNLQHDYRGGNLLKQEIYNANNALIGKEEYAYSPNGPSSTNSFYAIKQFTQSDLGTNNYSSQALAYYEAIKRLRLVSKTSTQYNRTGVGSGVSSTINYFYKEDMPLAYRNTYPGVHNQVVKTTQSDEENNTSESLIKYAADFDFGRDTTEYMVMECDIYGNNCVDVPYYEISIHVPNSSTEASAIFELKSKNMLYAPVESIQKLNNWTLAANYQSYFPANSSFKTLPHKNYVIRQSPLASFTDATFQLSNDAMIKDSRYGFEISEMLSYNPLGQALQGRAKYGSTVGIVYDPTNVLPISQTSNVGKSEALTSHIAYAKKFQGISQKTMPNGLYNTLEYENLTARQKNIKDKDGNILSQYSYNTVPTTQNTSNISWLNTDRTKLCSGSQITMKVYVTGLISGATAQFSTNGGSTWTNANIGNNGFSYTISPTDTYQTFMARASDNPSETISTQYHASCNTLANLSWGPYSVATQQVSPLVCQYNISVNGLKPDSYAEFSIDNNSWIRGNISDSQMRFLLLSSAGGNQDFWFRPADNPSEVRWGNLTSCTP